MRKQPSVISVEDIEVSPSCGKKIKLSANSPVNKTLVRELEHLLGSVPVARLSRSLRDLYLHYTCSEEVVNNHFVRDLSGDLYILLQFLDVAVDEQDRRHKKVS